MKTIEQHVKPLYKNKPTKWAQLASFCNMCKEKFYVFFLAIGFVHGFVFVFVFVFPPETTGYKLFSGVLKCQASVALLHLVGEINEKYLITSGNQFVLFYIFIYDRLAAVCSSFRLKRAAHPSNCSSLKFHLWFIYSDLYLFWLMSLKHFEINI